MGDPLYCHWDSHNENVLFDNILDLDNHLKSHYEAPENPQEQVACHWDACHEMISLDDMDAHLKSLHFKDLQLPHDSCSFHHDLPGGVPPTQLPQGAQLPQAVIQPPQVPQVPQMSQGAAPQYHDPWPTPPETGHVHAIQSHPQGHLHPHPQGRPQGHPQGQPQEHSHAPKLPLQPAPLPAQALEPCTCLWLDEAGEPCGQQFSNSHDLNAHLDHDHVARGCHSYSCRWQGCKREERPFVQRQKVVRHLQTHAKNWSFKCNICGHLSNDEISLRQHQRIHSGEKPHVCQVCGKRFTAMSSLTVHLRVHTGEKPLVCKFPGCGKRFAESSNLNKHMKTHLSRSIECPTCLRKFTRKDQLHRHTMVAHSEGAHTPQTHEHSQGHQGPQGHPQGHPQGQGHSHDSHGNQEHGHAPLAA